MTEEEARLRVHVGVPPAIEDDAGDVAPRLEAARRKHVRELLAKGSLDLLEGGGEHLHAAARSLLVDRQTGIRVSTLKVRTVGESGPKVFGRAPTVASLRTSR